jgi:hypothetical protein
MYLHVHEFTSLYVYCTYICIDVNTCLDTVQTCLCSFTSTLHFPSGPISLATPASLSSTQEQFLLSSRPAFLAPIFSTDRPPRSGLPAQTATATGSLHTHCCPAGHQLLQCHSCPQGSQTSCAGCTGEEW